MKIATWGDLNTLSGTTLSSNITLCPTYSEINNTGKFTISGSWETNQLVTLSSISLATFTPVYTHIPLIIRVVNESGGSEWESMNSSVLNASITYNVYGYSTISCDYTTEIQGPGEYVLYTPTELTEDTFNNSLKHILTPNGNDGADSVVTTYIEMPNGFPTVPSVDFQIVDYNGLYQDYNGNGMSDNGTYISNVYTYPYPNAQAHFGKDEKDNCFTDYSNYPVYFLVIFTV